LKKYVHYSTVLRPGTRTPGPSGAAVPRDVITPRNLDPRRAGGCRPGGPAITPRNLDPRVAQSAQQNREITPIPAAPEPASRRRSAWDDHFSHPRINHL